MKDKLDLSKAEEPHLRKINNMKIVLNVLYALIAIVGIVGLIIFF